MEFLLVFFLLYFLPALIAALRKHHDTGAIVAVNLLIGWTFLGWVASFVWSLTSTRRRLVAVAQDAPSLPLPPASSDQELAALVRLRRAGSIDDAQFDAASRQVTAREREGQRS